MFTLVKAFFLIILIVVGVFIFSVAGFIFKLFKTSRTFNANSSGSSNREDSRQKNESAQNTNQKVFSKDEGEYVDFVEIDEKK